MNELSRQEQRLLLALDGLRRAISSLDIAMDYDHPEELHPDIIDAIIDLEATVNWLRQFEEASGR